MEKNKYYQDKIRGCMVGGAAGDALGGVIEFWKEKEIFYYYKGGIQAYELTFYSGLAEISDDTQMTMFTANGILFGETRKRLEESELVPEYYIYEAYRDWLSTQEPAMEKAGISWILKHEDLHHRRGPGRTCLASLKSGKMGTLEEAINMSKGCGGVMRVAPIGIYYGKNISDLDEMTMLGAKVAAITHGHPLGYMPGAALAYIINRIVYCDDKVDLYAITAECRGVLERLFSHEESLSQMLAIMDKTVELSRNDKPDLENIHELGEGWIADEALAIALYCSLRYANDFSKAIITAVNHNGDSDSTGAIAGNIVGAIIGYEQMEEKWKQNLELRDVILELADDLCGDFETDEAWLEKYGKN